jgi:hypothetical protein
MGLQLFELAPHLVDGLVELLHPILKRGVLLGWLGPMVNTLIVEGRGGVALKGELCSGGALQHALELSAPFRLLQEPPGQATGPSHGPDDNPKDQGAAIGLGVIPGLSHGVNGENSVLVAA